MAKKIILTIIVLILLILTITGIKGMQIAAMVESGKNASPPPLSISSFEVKKQEWENTLPTIGSLEAAKGLVITADLSGRIAKILFNAGSKVKAGDLLVQQDTSAEKAQLRSAQAAVILAKNNFDRINELYKQKVVSKSEFDNSQSSYQSAIADVDNIQATIEKKSIRAPFDGRLGIRLVNLGQSINAGEPVVSLQETNQMFVNFSLPQQWLSKIAVGLTVKLTSDAVPNKTYVGTIKTIEPEIDVATRSIKVQAIITNSEQTLLPGMFANISVVLPETKQVLLIPITAVQYATFGDSVFVVEQSDTAKNSDNDTKNQLLTVRQQFVKLGETRGDFVIVEKGLKENQIVASAGVFKLRNEAAVVINNSVVPDFSLKPKVENK